MSFENQKWRALDYAVEAVERPAESAVDYGRKAIRAASPALVRGAVATLGPPVLLAPQGVRVFDLPVARRNVAVGELISLDVGLAFQLTHWLSGGILTDVRWNIPGQVVKSYELTHKPTKVVLLSEHDKSHPTIAFHWVDTGMGRNVTAACKVALPLLNVGVSVIFRAAFDVKAPTLTRLREHRRKKADRGRTRIGGNRAGEKGIKLLEFTGKISRRTKLGIRRHSGTVWDWKVTAPVGHPGQIKDLQTFVGIRERTNLLERGGTETERQRFKMVNKPMRANLAPGLPLGQSILDSTKIEDPEPRYGSEFPMPIDGGESLAQIAGNDSPDHALSKDGLVIRSFVHERFKYFVLYKADTKGSIWVPVGKAEWFWKGEAVRKLDDPWRLVQRDGGVTDEGGPTTVFPEYDGHAGELDWKNVEPNE